MFSLLGFTTDEGAVLMNSQNKSWIKYIHGSGTAEEITFDSLNKEETDKMLSNEKITFAIYKRDENFNT